MVVFFGVVGVMLLGCGNDKSTEKTVEEIRTESLTGNASIIRSPISANAITDTVNVAKIEFKETEYNFGTVTAGSMVVHEFEFTNTGRVPLIINEARSTCGCTVPEYPQELILPGKKGVIQVRFNTTNMLNAQKKPVIVTANTYPSETKVYLVGNVQPDAKSQ
ncbi:MAG: DUF1573 domain-containing protein [Saprospiraceae bacterium]|nr:DUF1573 domain-containing protein [Saprospiraceae bacterium]